LAFDFCVRYSAKDALRERFEVVVVEDACRGIDESLEELGVTRILADAVG
jgi:nicotinamidase-related amidase